MPESDASLAAGWNGETALRPPRRLPAALERASLRRRGPRPQPLFPHFHETLLAEELREYGIGGKKPHEVPEQCVM
jgi:hypothetical protein